jgi:thioredoxin-dependent peroxiredoxin
MNTVKFRAGDTIISEGEDGNSAFLIVTGEVMVSIGQDSKAKTVTTLGAGEVFGEMCLIEPGPRSASVKAVTDAECVVTSYDDFIPSMQNGREPPFMFMKTLVRRFREINNLLSIAPAEVLGQRIQQSLQVILAGLEEREALNGADLEALGRELRMLLQIDRIQIATAEIDKAEQVLQYMLRPNIEECLNLWFGKSEQTDQDILNRFGADVALASRGQYDHWALNVEHPRLLVALVIMLDQFTRNLYRDTPQMYVCDARCQALVKRGLRVGVGSRLRPIERVFLCLVLTHSEALDDQLLCMEEWGRAMEDLAPDDPLNVFHEIFHRHVAVIKRFGRFPHRNKILKRANTVAEEDFLNNSSFRFDLPLIRRSDGTFAFAGTVKKRIVKLFDHEYETLLPDLDEVGHRAFEYKYLGPDGIFTRTQEQLKKQGYIRIGDTVPDFTAETSMGPINFHEFIGDSWCVFFSHPADFTPVCTTEFGVTAKLRDEWKARGTKVIGLSVDSADDHERWIADINETQHTKVNFPIIADKDRRVSMLFGMLDPTTFRHGSSLGETMTVRSVFFISPSKRVELILSYPAFIGRNFNEILRVLDALQLSAKYRVATPANWQPGDDTVVLPFISDEEAERMFGDQGGFRKVRSYLRFVRDPSLRCL